MNLQMTNPDLNILSIETSCDETAASVVNNGQNILSNVVSSQTDVHQLYGGVVPEIASREHLKLLSPIVNKALDEANINRQDLDAVAVTQGPGLVGPLLVGLSYGKALAYSLDIPLIPVNHIKAHIYANFLSPDCQLSSRDGEGNNKNNNSDNDGPEFPIIALVVSGGHTNIYYMADHSEIELLGTSVDDAAGEAFDKIARALELGYPGGPAVEKAANQGSPNIDLPKPRLKSQSEGSEYNFSFSGLKSAVLNYLNHKRMKGEEFSTFDLCSSFQQIVVEMLADNTFRAAKDMNVSNILIAGGVSANQALRNEFSEGALAEGLNLTFPKLAFCTDNAAMIGALAYHNYREGIFASLDLNAVPNLAP